MNTRPLSDLEGQNLEVIRQSEGDFALLYITGTQLEKSIIDATQPMRTLLQEKGIHDFQSQGLGAAEFGRTREAVMLEDECSCPIKVSLYRPKTKKGDPRIWPSMLGAYASHGDVLAIFVHSGEIHFLNLTRSRLAEDIGAGRSTRLAVFFSGLLSAASTVAGELLGLLSELASCGPIETVGHGDTAIGRSVEAALGISMNANKTPDYKGIELKSYRSTKPENGLITLFSKTPDWNRSLLKGSKDFLTRFGYERNGRRQLYCSVYAPKPNSQGLQLKLNSGLGDLEEFHFSKRSEVLAVWALDTLHGDFRKKHNETFWIKATPAKDSRGRESFGLHSVIHTKRPMITQFDEFLVEGQICLDHTISQRAHSAKDHGYLFRVRQERFTKLFSGEPARYPLS